ncbi:MAG TPA: O-acetyl-ADP-ribose deacetylase [Candidatus Polarisedimenticolia bacterium]|jgi:O-acetyl-ADP-ribose deacetylase (regulator of RNase III)
MMKVAVVGSTLELLEGDITQQEVDAIVNAANSQLAGGGGVDGAIHKAGGPAIMIECRKIGGCPTGQAVATTAGALAATHVIHAVGPVYRDGMQGEPELLANAYRSAFQAAADLGDKTIATPSLSTGAFGYPLDPAARIAVGVALECLTSHPNVSLIRFVLRGNEAYSAYCRALEEMAPTQRLNRL